VVLVSALAGAVLTPSTDPVTMLLLSGAITALYLIGVGLVALVQGVRPGGIAADRALAGRAP
jgi:sec-independent protein translocase protein TatC